MVHKNNSQISSSTPIATNTLLITDFPSTLFNQTARQQLQEILLEYGTLLSIVPFKFMNRYIVTFENTSDAVKAQLALHKSIVLNHRINVYFGQHTDINSISNSPEYLKVPEIEKNFLLSPPGSPPIDWVQERESAPVRAGHASLLDELNNFKLSEDLPEIASERNNDDITYSRDGTRITLSFGSCEDFGKSLPIIVVDNYDGEKIDTLMGGGKPKMIPKTCMPSSV